MKYSFLEKYFLLLESLPFINCYSSSSLVLLSTYILVQLFVSFMTGVKTIKWNIFVVRDVIASIILPPLYIHFMRLLRKLPDDIKNDIMLSKQELDAFFDKHFSLIVDSKRMAIVGAVFSLFYTILLIYYVLTQYYAIEFFHARLVGILGVFIVGCIFYQALIILKIFIFDVRGLPLEISSIFNGLKPVSSIASFASAIWTIAVSIIMLPIFLLGFNPRSLIWYVFFYGSLYALALVIFVLIMYGFHVNMVNVKRTNIAKLTNIINSMYSLIQFESDTRQRNLSILVGLLDMYERIVNSREWPFEIRTIREVLFSYILPIATYLFSVAL